MSNITCEKFRAHVSSAAIFVIEYRKTGIFSIIPIFLQGVYIDLGKTDLTSDKIGGIRLAYLNKFCIIK